MLSLLAAAAGLLALTANATITFSPESSSNSNSKSSLLLGPDRSRQSQRASVFSLQWTAAQVFNQLKVELDLYKSVAREYALIVCRKTDIDVNFNCCVLGVSASYPLA
jgi:hypothetical protein